MNRRPIQGVSGRSRPRNGRPAHSTPVWRQCRAPKVDTSPAIHRCHANGIVQGRLLHAYATPMIFNWDVWYHYETIYIQAPQGDNGIIGYIVLLCRH